MDQSLTIHLFIPPDVVFSFVIIHVSGIYFDIKTNSVRQLVGLAAIFKMATKSMSPVP